MKNEEDNDCDFDDFTIAFNAGSTLVRTQNPRDVRREGSYLMISIIGLMIDIISFLFAVVVLPVCTIAFWLNYDDPMLSDTEAETTKNTTDKHLKGETP